MSIWNLDEAFAQKIILLALLEVNYLIDNRVMKIFFMVKSFLNCEMKMHHKITEHLITL